MRIDAGGGEKMGGWRLTALVTGTLVGDHSLPSYLSDLGRRSQAMRVTAAGSTYCIAGDAVVTYQNFERGR
jgi:hypothetical protein